MIRASVHAMRNVVADEGKRMLDLCESISVGGSMSQKPTPLHDRMHAVSPETRELVDLVLDYSRRRILSRTPRSTSRCPSSSCAGSPARPSPRTGIGAERALALFEHVLAPACITTDHPQLPVVHPDRARRRRPPRSTSSSRPAPSTADRGWRAPAPSTPRTRCSPGWPASSGCPPTAGGVFVQGGTLGNLSALVAAREHARAGPSAANPRRPLGDRLQRRGALVDRVGRPGDGRRGRRRSRPASAAC